GLFIYSVTTPGFKDSLVFLFYPDFKMLTPSGVLEAVGHSFFTLSLGMGAIMTYGSYLKKSEDLIKTAFYIGLADTIIALMAGIVIFSIVFTYGLEPSSGPKLMFETLPTLFSKDAAGNVLAMSFFGLVLFAALTSSVSLLQVVVSYFEENSNLSKTAITLLSAFSIFCLGILSALSTNLLSDFYVVEGLTFFDFFDKLSSHYLLPLGGLLMAVFFGWKLDAEEIKKIFLDHPKTKLYFFVLIWSNRILAPLAILIMTINSIFS
ncbi:MAG: sodium-dependent transporter, partial [Bdellovibrionales bacterium]|nr:sodium-dependent transporter [Bdellovibrionales bacterium]